MVVSLKIQASANCGNFFSISSPRMQTILEDYEVLSTVGTGSYGTCKKIRRKKDGKVRL